MSLAAARPRPNARVCNISGTLCLFFGWMRSRFGPRAAPAEPRLSSHRRHAYPLSSLVPPRGGKRRFRRRRALCTRIVARNCVLLAQAPTTARRPGTRRPARFLASASQVRSRRSSALQPRPEVLPEVAALLLLAVFHFCSQPEIALESESIEVHNSAKHNRAWRWKLGRLTNLFLSPCSEGHVMVTITMGTALALRKQDGSFS